MTKKNILLMMCLSLASSTTISAQEVTTYFDRGQVKAITNYIDGTHTDIKEGVKSGIEKVFYQSGKLGFVVNYIDGKRDGKLTWYDEKDKKLSDQYYKNGNLEGTETYYFVENGVVKHRVNYKNDKKEGLQKEYFINSQLASVVNYVNSKKEGFQKEYTENGSLFSKVLYKDNYKEGNQVWYDKQGKIIKTIFYKMDRPLAIMKKIQEKKSDKELVINSIDFSPQNPE